MEEAQALPNSLEDFAERFEALSDIARDHGIESHIILADPDQLSGNTKMASLWNGCAYRMIGMLGVARADLAKDTREA